MYIRVSKSEFKSSNQRNKVQVKGYRLDEKNLLGIVIVLHGMSECKEIYTELAEYLAMRDYGVITYDHIGHGDSINNKDEQGFFANENGYQYLIQDLAFLVNEAKKFHLPIFLVGHSMGALIARAYMAQKKNKDITGLVSCGTIGPQWAIDGAIQLAEYMIDKKGPRYRSRKLNQLVTKVSTWKFEKVEYPLEWITRDKDFIRKVKDDEKMNFIFTAAGLKDVFLLTKLVGQKETIEKMPKDLPILLLSGKDDILGEYGEGVSHLVEAYRKAGMQEVMVKIYEGARHNLLQELNRKEVEKDIYDWIEAVRVAAMDGKSKKEEAEK